MSVTVGVSLKSYLGHRGTLTWASAVAEALRDGPQPGLELFVLPSFPTLTAVAQILAGSGVAVGAQDLSADDAGNRTGEVTGAMLAEIGCRYALTGHAERRFLFRETDAVVAAKTRAAIRHGLIPVVCVGETERVPTGTAVEVCTQQLADALPGDKPISSRLLVAYEPGWAIGADRPASDGHIIGIIAGLRDELRRRAPDSAVIYGGSAGPGLLTRLGHAVDGLFLGRFAHDPDALAAVVAEAGNLTRLARPRQESLR